MCTKFELIRVKIEEVIRWTMKFSPCKNAQGKKDRYEVLDLHYRYQPSILSSPKQHLHKWKLPTKSRALEVYRSKKSTTPNLFSPSNKIMVYEVMNLDYRYEPSFLSSPKYQLHWWKLCGKSQALKPSHCEKSTTSSLSIHQVWFNLWMKCWFSRWDLGNSFYHLACIHSICPSYVTSLRHWKGFLPKFYFHLDCHFPFCWWDKHKAHFFDFSTTTFAIDLMIYIVAHTYGYVTCQVSALENQQVKSYSTHKNLRIAWNR